MMGKWAIGLRVSGSTDQIIEKALNRGDILRTHLMRPTWHFVSREDIYWILELTAPRVRSALRSRQKQLEITPEVEKKSNELLVTTISKNGYSTREDIVDAFKKAKFSLSENRMAHLLLIAELEGLICSGEIRKNKPSYALLEERVPQKKLFPREESLARLTKKYFTSHGPAELKDFAWWSGLTVKDAAAGLEMVKQGLRSEKMDGRTFWMDPSAVSDPGTDTVILLPAFDEYIISYRDRSAVITEAEHLRNIAGNGMFWPVILVDGRAAGIWKRTVKNDKVIIELNYFKKPTRALIGKVKQSAGLYADFLGKKLYLSF